MKFNHTAHKELWNWLADNPGKDKTDWPGWNSNGGDKCAINLCFCCTYAASFDTGSSCLKCPLVWGENENPKCGDLESPFYRWSSGKYNRSDLARQIANLPVREGVECE